MEEFVKSKPPLGIGTGSIGKMIGYLETCDTLVYAEFIVRTELYLEIIHLLQRISGHTLPCPLLWCTRINISERGSQCSHNQCWISSSLFISTSFSRWFSQHPK